MRLQGCTHPASRRRLQRRQAPLQLASSALPARLQQSPASLPRPPQLSPASQQSLQTARQHSPPLRPLSLQPPRLRQQRSCLHSLCLRPASLRSLQRQPAARRLQQLSPPAMVQRQQLQHRRQSPCPCPRAAGQSGQPSLSWSRPWPQLWRRRQTRRAQPSWLQTPALPCPHRSWRGTRSSPQPRPKEPSLPLR